jgi:hypothetical protein
VFFSVSVSTRYLEIASTGFDSEAESSPRVFACVVATRNKCCPFPVIGGEILVHDFTGVNNDTPFENWEVRV